MAKYPYEEWGVKWSTSHNPLNMVYKDGYFLAVVGPTWADHKNNKYTSDHFRYSVWKCAEYFLGQKELCRRKGQTLMIVTFALPGYDLYLAEAAIQCGVPVIVLLASTNQEVFLHYDAGELRVFETVMRRCEMAHLTINPPHTCEAYIEKGAKIWGVRDKFAAALVHSALLVWKRGSAGVVQGNFLNTLSDTDVYLPTAVKFFDPGKVSRHIGAVPSAAGWIAQKRLEKEDGAKVCPGCREEGLLLVSPESGFPYKLCSSCGWSRNAY